MTVLSTEPDPDLAGMTKAQLLAYAASAGVSGVDSTMKKADILTAIKGAL